MNIFSSLPVYADKWTEKARRAFSPEEIKAVDSATVVASKYGSSVCFVMASGGQTYIPLSTNSTLAVGDTVDLSKASLLTLSRAGEEDIYRVKA